MRRCAPGQDPPGLVIPRPGHAVAGFHTRGCRAEESTVGLLEGRRGSPAALEVATQADRASAGRATGHQQQTVDFSVGAQIFVRAHGAVWRLLRNDGRRECREFLNTPERRRPAARDDALATKRLRDRSRRRFHHHRPRRRGAPPRLRQDQDTTGTTLPSKMRIFCPSNLVSSKNASSSLKPSDISCSSPMAIASPKGSDSV
jgi:hypothetical protein